MEHYVYILKSQRNGRYYTGFSGDTARRLAAHNAGQVAATKHLAPWEIVYVEAQPDATSARKREHQIKSMKRASSISNH